MDISKFAGMSWDAWTKHVEAQRKEVAEPRVNESKANKLQKEDMKIFGFCVDVDPLQLVECEKCGRLVKPQALLHHYTTRHSEDRPAENHVSDSTSEVEVVAAPKRLKRVDSSRPPLGKVCPNRWHYKKKESSARNKSNLKNVASLNSCEPSLQEENMETSSQSSLEADSGVNHLLDALPQMSLSSLETAGNKDSVSFLSMRPRALSAPPLFSCHRAGGLIYPGRRTRVARQNLLDLFGEGGSVSNGLFQRRNAQSKKITL